VYIASKKLHVIACEYEGGGGGGALQSKLSFGVHIYISSR